MQNRKSGRTRKRSTSEAVGQFFVYLIDFDYEVIATVAENVTQPEAKTVAAETECGDNQMIVVSHKEWYWWEEVFCGFEVFSGISIRKSAVGA